MRSNESAVINFQYQFPAISLQKLISSNHLSNNQFSAVNELIIKGIYRTASAIPGLLFIIYVKYIHLQTYRHIKNLRHHLLYNFFKHSVLRLPLSPLDVDTAGLPCFGLKLKEGKNIKEEEQGREEKIRVEKRRVGDQERAVKSTKMCIRLQAPQNLSSSNRKHIQPSLHTATTLFDCTSY